MSAFTSTASKLGMILIYSVCCVLFLRTANAQDILVNAPIGQNTSYEITPSDFPTLVNPGFSTFLQVCLGEDVGTCFGSLEAKGKVNKVFNATPTETVDINGQTVSYTPSNSATAGDTFGVPFEVCYGLNGLCENSMVTGDLVFRVVESGAGAIAIKNAGIVFDEEVCPNSPQEDIRRDASVVTANKAFTTQDCSGYDSLSDAEKLLIQSEINPEEVVAEYTVTKQLVAAQTDNIFKRLDELRSGSEGVSISGLTYSNDGDQLSGQWLHAIADSIGGAAGADEPGMVSNWGFFINGSITDGDRDGTNLERGYDNDANTVTLGIDYRFSRHVVAGIAYGLSESTLEFDGNNDDMDNDITNFMIYGTWYKDAFNVDLLAGTSRGEIETSRNISFVNSTAEGETESKVAFFSIASGYEFSNGALSYGPYASYDYITGEIDSYQEINGGGLELGFDDQDIESQVFSMGGRTSYAISTSWGVVVPYARAEWKKEFDDSRDIISGRFVSTTAKEAFAIEAENFDSSWFQAAVGITATFRYGLSAYIDYDSVLSYDDTQLATLSYGGTWEASF